VKKPSGPYADKLWREALRRAVLKRVENDQKLDKVAEAVVAKAMNGDIAAAKEIGDRLDGKASQAIVHSGTLSVAGQFALLRQREAKAVQRGEAKAEERFDRRLVQRGGI
jgi:hypothetical protein